jgi:SAM-dependent methyltransferase
MGTLKNPKLLGLLRSPDDPDGEPLKIEGDVLVNAGWLIPVVKGIPDFVTYAPPIGKSLDCVIPIKEIPPPAVLKLPDLEKAPKWFREDPYKYWLLKEHEKGFLLDVGCGQGNRETFEKLAYDYIGLDISFNSQQRQSGPADLDIVADCHRLPLPSNSIQVVNSTAVLEHLYWPAIAVQEITRVLNPGGLMIGSCSFLEGEHYESQCHFSWLGLYRLLKIAGLQVRCIYPGLSLWEIHSGSIYWGLPGHKCLGKWHRRLYLFLVKLKNKESPQMRLLRRAAALHFIAMKE